ncbi:MAG: transcription-repair coupling factor, partial [Chloroflexi bacterium]|nr:transcription-repair coupling factor [Chloroflexota bacterium]
MSPSRLPASPGHSLSLRGLLPLLDRRTDFSELQRFLASDAVNPWPALNLPEAARSFVIAALHQSTALVLTARRQRAWELAEQLRAWLGRPEGVHLVPEPDVLPYERTPWEASIRQGRVAALAALHLEKSPVLVASARACLPATMPPPLFRQGTLKLRVGEFRSPERVVGHLNAWGYQPVNLVEEAGTYCRRGGILDVYSPAESLPVRLEYLASQIESLRAFDPSSQVSTELLASTTLVPAREARPSPAEERGRWEGRDLSTCHPRAAEEFEDDLEKLRLGEVLPHQELYLAMLYPEPGCWLDHLPSHSLVLIDDALALEQAMMDLEREAAQQREESLGRGDIPPWLPGPYGAAEEIRARLRSHRLLKLSSTGEAVPGPNLGLHPNPAFGGRLEEAIVQAVEMAHSRQRVVIVSRQASRLAELCAEWGSTPPAQASALDTSPNPGGLVLVPGTLTRGFRLELPDGNLILLGDGDLFGFVRIEPRRPLRSRPSAVEAFFADVRPGNYVVHVEHGIGLYQGLVLLQENGLQREYLKVAYAEGDELYVPTYHADRLARYVGPDESRPNIDRLGTTDWDRVVSKAKRAVEEIAEELLALYSARELVEGFAYPPDTPWQQELESSFPYLETADQWRAIQEIKREMEQPRPMDRLVCGDVGYGKTEVALRAAFKAVMGGKQVAVLVPTTILAQQHHRTFSQRLQPFPVEVEMLSRFRPPKEQAEIVRRLQEGSIDIVVGTHRLLQPDVIFKDLGLLIIDEEQRFGVVDKERLKEMRREVDVLTLTATPIPRTLHLSLTGARDISIIETPPEERLPVVTQVTAYDEGLIRRAILRELDRGGQIYFIHNRVRSIQYMAARLGRLVPEARLAVAHGQMDEAVLAQTMLDFAEGRYDLLVSTSIIENGIDIPNVNTLIVNKADRFGLAELYQLRGRVGRSSVRAHSYFLYDEELRLSPEARERLQAIQEASELGSGFRIAMRDLELRGAGEILGSRQHGHIAAVGFDLYTKLLAQAVRDLKAGRMVRSEITSVGDGASAPSGEGAAAPGPTIDLPVEARLPADYVPDAALRLSLYRRLAQLTQEQDIEAMQAELRDRFGELPPAAQDLLWVLRLRVRGTRAGLESIRAERERIVLRLSNHLRAPLALPAPAQGRGNLIWLPYKPGYQAKPLWRRDLETVLERLR